MQEAKNTVTIIASIKLGARLKIENLESPLKVNEVPSSIWFFQFFFFFGLDHPSL